jgi:hypothetical protein
LKGGDMIPNARFWEYVNGDWVKMTLRFGQELSWSKFQYVEEGWDFQGCEWEHTGGAVLYRSTHNALDCDGRFDRECEFACQLSELQAREHFDSDLKCSVLLPIWVEVDYFQRDHSAEAVGY